jgi:hypothetical protein
VSRDPFDSPVTTSFRVLFLAIAAAPFVAAGVPKQEAFERAYDLFDSADAFVRGIDRERGR